MAFKQPKMRIDIFLEASDINILSNYARERHLKNYSHAISEILKEWRRFQTIALQMQKQNEQQAEMDRQSNIKIESISVEEVKEK